MIDIHKLNVDKSYFEKLTQITPDMISIFDDSIPFLERTKANNYQCVVVSDCGPDTGEYIKTSKIKNYFSKVYLSYEYRTTKKEELYDKMLSTINFNKDGLIMIGDDFERDFVIPRKKGIAAIFLDRSMKKSKSSEVIHNLTDLIELLKYEK